MSRSVIRAARARLRPVAVVLVVVALGFAGVGLAMHPASASMVVPSPRLTAGSSVPHGVQSSSHSIPHSVQLCGQLGWPEVPVDQGIYRVQNDEWNSTAPECVATDGGPEFSVESSAIDLAPTGDPGGYPGIFLGCDMVLCTEHDPLPIAVDKIQPQMILSDWRTVQPKTGAYDVAYDIWFNRTPWTKTTANADELMIWLAHRGDPVVQPAGHAVARIFIAGHSYTVYRGTGAAGDPLVTYVMFHDLSSVHDLDIGAVIASAARHGYLHRTAYLIDIQAGFELWQDGAGLKTRSFSVMVRR
jgi:hypothetical protein